MFGSGLDYSNIHSKECGYIQDVNSGLNNLSLAFDYLRYKSTTNK
jgi:hypothetical protein